MNDHDGLAGFIEPCLPSKVSRPPVLTMSVPGGKADEVDGSRSRHLGAKV